MVTNSPSVSWPESYIAAINSAVNRALTEPLEPILSEISALGDRFRGDQNFEGNLVELERSILRNKILAATLSREPKVHQLILDVLAEIESSGYFSEEELNFERRVVDGKIRGY